MNTIHPVFLIGNGLRNAPQVLEMMTKLGVPILTTWQGCDLISEDSPVFCGRPGSIGQRAANIIQQKSNFLMVVGARLDQEQVGHNLAGFAPNCAIPIVVDCDGAELEKYPKHWGRYLIDLSSPASRYGQSGLPFVDGDPEWLAECKAIYARFRPELEGQEGGNVIDPYLFINTLSDVCGKDDVLVPGSSGMQSCAFFQAFKVKAGQRVLCCNTIGAMGMEPMAIGAAIASGRRVIVVTGDGGFAQNMQELEVVRRMNLPIHYFVFDNAGYGSIASMQDSRFGLRVGATKESGFTVPYVSYVAELFAMPFDNLNINKRDAINLHIRGALEIREPTITRVVTSLDFRYANRVQSTLVNNILVPDRMEDVSPKLDPEELERLMKGRP